MKKTICNETKEIKTMTLNGIKSVLKTSNADGNSVLKLNVVTLRITLLNSLHIL